MNLNEIDCAIDVAVTEFDRTGELDLNAGLLIEATKTLRANTTLNQLNKNEVIKMKPFDLEAAKNGAAVVAGDGSKARVICFDVNDSHGYKVAACVTDKNGFQSVRSYTNLGIYDKDRADGARLNLFMKPVKKECWINFYGAGNSVGHAYASKAIADKFADNSRISCIHHTWEE